MKAKNVDMLVIRETSEGMFARMNDVHEPSDESASDRMTIIRATCEKLFDFAFSQARSRRKLGTPGHVTLPHKSIALRSNVLMEKLFDEDATKNHDIGSIKFYIDAGSMHMVTHPEPNDVIVTENILATSFQRLLPASWVVLASPLLPTLARRTACSSHPTEAHLISPAGDLQSDGDDFVSRDDAGVAGRAPRGRSLLQCCTEHSKRR